MGIVWNSSGCKNVSTQLDDSCRKLSSLLGGELEATINRAKNAYASASADEIFLALKRLQSKGPQFIDAVHNCSRYLSNKVAPAYEEAERRAADRVGN